MNEEPSTPNPWMRHLMVWGGVALALLLVLSILVRQGDGAATQMGYSDFRARVTQGVVAEVEVGDTHITGKMKNGDKFTTIPIPNDTTLAPLLAQNGVKYSGRAPDEQNLLLAILFQVLPFVLIISVGFFVMRQMQKGGGGGAMGFGKSKAKMLTEKSGRKTFADVAGIDEAREELQEIVEFLKDPARFSKLGGTCSNRPRKTPPASSSSTKSTRSAGIAATAWAIPTTSASRR